MGEDRTVASDKKRWILSIRTTADGRRRLQDAAKVEGRSLSDEIERRLQQTFHTDDTHGGPANAAFVHLLGAIIREAESASGRSWRDDLGTWTAVSKQITAEIKARKPSGRTSAAAMDE